MNSEQFEHIRTICERPSMYVSPGTLRGVYAYLSGMDRATGCLTGFREWLLPRFDAGNNLYWTGVVNMTLAAESVSGEREVARLGELITEFYDFTKVDDGLLRVYLRYHVWLLNSSWYRDGWPGYIAPYDGMKILQTEGRHVRLLDLPGYREWSQQKLAAGEPEALIADLDATTIWLLPREVGSVTAEDFEEWLDDLKVSIQEGS